LGSDYDQYRYLMDNALASKDALNLSLGVLGEVNVTAGKDVDAIAADIVTGKDVRFGGQNARIVDAAN